MKPAPHVLPFWPAAVGLILMSSVAWSQTPKRQLRQEIKEVDDKVLQLQQRWRRPEGVQARREVANLLLRRAEALGKLIEESPSEALRVGFPEDFSTEVAAELLESASVIEKHGTWEGMAEHLVFDEPDLIRHRDLVRLRRDDDVAELYFAAGFPKALKTGDRLRVSGMRLGGRIAVKETENAPAAVEPCCGELNGQNAAVILATFPNVAPPIDASHINTAFFGAGQRSLDGYWRESSYGKMWLSGSVHGWYTLDQPYTCDQYQQLRDAAIRAADADIDFRQVNRLFIIFPNISTCSWAGLSTVGSAAVNSPQDGTFAASTSWLIANYMFNADRAVQLAAHEGGHGLGLHHAASADYGAETIGPVGVTASLNEYGDGFSSMGSWNLGHYSARHKAQLGWMTEGSDYLTVESSATLPVQPMELSGGVRALKVRRGTGNDAWLWLEYRQPLGSYDITLPASVFKGALAHYVEPTTGTRTNLIDFTPATSWSDTTLLDGSTWHDAYTNTSIRTQATPGSLSVGVSYGAVPCVQVAPSASLSPLNQSAYAGAPVLYTLTVTNRNSGACGVSAFDLSAAAPEGWTAALHNTAVTLAPGESASTAWTVTPAETALAAVYTLRATASAAAGATAAEASCTIRVPPEPLTILLDGPQQVASRSNVSITTAVKNGSSPAPGRNVSVTLVKPTGAKETKTLTTNNQGVAVWKYKLGPKDGPGPYNVRADTSESGTAVSASMSFTVT